MRYFRNADLNGKSVLVRAEFNSVADKDGNIFSDFRIRPLKNSLDYIFKHGASKVILIGHRGRPVGYDPRFSLESLFPLLEKIIGRKIYFCPSVSIKIATDFFKSLPKFGVGLLENLRFDPRERENDLFFAQELSSLADVFINDAFSVCHRPHASVFAVADLMPSFAGPSLEKEIFDLEKFFSSAKSPMVAVFGGLKIKIKLSAIMKLSERADKIILGAALAESLKKDAEDGEIFFKLPKGIREKFLFPVDYLVGRSFSDSDFFIKKSEALDFNEKAFDIGPKTIEIFQSEIEMANSVVWNGPMGYVSENSAFEKGTMALIKSISSSEISLVGGGETVQILEKSGYFDKISFVSSGGGAFLDYLAGKELPGLKALGYYG